MQIFYIKLIKNIYTIHNIFSKILLQIMLILQNNKIHIHHLIIRKFYHILFYFIDCNDRSLAIHNLNGIGS